MRAAAASSRLVFGRGTKLGRLAFESGEFVSGGGQARARHTQRLPQPLLFTDEIRERLLRLLDLGGRFDPDLCQLGVDRFDLPPPAVTLGVRSSKDLAPVACFQPLALRGLFVKEVPAAIRDLPLFGGYRALHSLAEPIAFPHIGLKPVNVVFDKALVTGRFVKAVDVLFH